MSSRFSKKDHFFQNHSPLQEKEKRLNSARKDDNTELKGTNSAQKAPALRLKKAQNVKKLRIFAKKMIFFQKVA